ncbi:MAG: SOUL family heme-binding protein [Steroidobacteraceae bacterium]
MRSLFSSALVAALALIASPTTMAIEEPGFRTLEQDGSFELREYSPYVVAETRVEAGFEEAGSVAFQRLFRYISGNNAPQQKIAMTAPVTQARGEKISMTAPVVQSSADGKVYVVAFTLPAAYTAANAPKPLDPAVRIRAVPSQLIASWRYSGRWTEGNYREQEALLRARLKARGLAASGDAVLARYNAPFTPWFMRRNEVLIPVSPPARH